MRNRILLTNNNALRQNKLADTVLDYKYLLTCIKYKTKASFIRRNILIYDDTRVSIIIWRMIIFI